MLLHGMMYEVRVEDEQSRPRAGRWRRRPPSQRRIPAARPDARAGGGRPRRRRRRRWRRAPPLVMLESMKMQNELRSQKDGTVREIRVATGPDGGTESGAAHRGITRRAAPPPARRKVNA